MAFLKRNRRKKANRSANLESLVKEITSNTDKNRHTTLFIALLAFIRPQPQQEVTENLKNLNEVLHANTAFKTGVQNIFFHLLNTREIETLFTDVGILKSNSFFEEFSRQIRHRLLPPVPNKKSFNNLLERTFTKTDDYKWVNEIPNSLWIDFFNAMYSGISNNAAPLKRQMMDALITLSIRVSYLGLEDEFSSHLRAFKGSENDSPFVEQNRQVQTFLMLISTHNTGHVFIKNSAEKIREYIVACEQIIVSIRENTKSAGTSLKQSYTLLRTSQLLQRMRVIIRFLTPGDLPQIGWENTTNLFKALVYSINTRTSITLLYKKNVEMLAYQIAEHKSESGEHYITTTRNEYTDFFYAAVAGGGIIAVAALLKALLHMIKMPLFWEYFNYGLNYAIAFVLLFVTGASLATKQPTMTASALASALDSKKSKGDISLKGLALTFAKVWRSQFASFAGNLIVVFPLSYMIAVGWDALTGTPLLGSRAEALQALRDQNPTKSLAWYYACITGVALFISGIITGFFDNKATYSNIGARITEHPALRRIFSGERLRKAGNYIQRNLGGIIGNISLGFMLGFAALIGKFFGFPFDIRHITISTAYFAFGVAGLDNELTLRQWVETTVGVIGIGFFNFAVSFGLAFYVALRSRSVSLTRVPRVGRLIGHYFIKFPLDFIYPPLKERKESEVFGGKSN